VATDEDTPVTIALADLLANDLDPDPGDVLSLAGIDIGGLIGMLVYNGDGIFVYDPAGGFEYLAEGESATDGFTYTVVDQSGRTGTASVVITIHGVDEPEVVGRYVFYNNSALDGNDPDADAADDEAIATDKTPLLPGQTATFANYTSYHRGINGIMVDLVGVTDPDGVTLETLSEYFRFKVGNSDDPSTWDDAPPPSAVTVRQGAGRDGSDRVTIVWPDHAIHDQWLQVTVLAAKVGLPKDDVFYFGNAVAESGNSNTDARVSITDLLLARNNPRNFLSPAPIDFAYDYNRDRRVNVTDVLLARNNQTSFLDALKLIQPMEADTVLRAASTVEEPSPLPTRPQPWFESWQWLYEMEQRGEQNQPVRESDSAAKAVDELLATYWP
ncbi:MAG TPA: cadherin-like domain-containing protein, partial [Thermoguttaceae bacterium]|nr:cadherin-like domain-containing protein [Thermoguttaceae bacterium]